MTKVSRQLQLLLASSMPSTLQLVEFEQPDGDKILINPTQVAAVEEKSGDIRITLNDGSTTKVIGTLTEAQVKLEG